MSDDSSTAPLPPFDSATEPDRARPGTPARSGKCISHYRLLRELGRGGQATVYLAQDLQLSRQVALKVLEGYGAADRTAFARFRREAEVMSKIDHPGICPVYEAGEDGDAIWIAMRYVEGQSLAKSVAAAKSALEPMIRATPAPDRIGGESAPSAARAQTWPGIDSVIALFEKIARTLHVAHEHGIIHRDLKPGNIMVTNDGEPVILDFGLAHDTQNDESALTLTGDILGTPAYMSPEQVSRNLVRIDQRTDVYSLGVALFECLTLERPFDAPTREGLYQAILTKDPPNPARLNHAIPRDLAIVLATALEKDRDRRYRTALDFAEELRRVRSFEPIKARPAGPLLRLRRFAQRNPALATAIGGVFVTLVAGLAVALTLLRESERERLAKVRALDEKATALDDYDRLGDLTRLQQLQTDAEALWPAEPAKVPDLRAWIARASELAGRLPGHRAVLDRIRQAAAPGGPPWRFESPVAQFKHDTTAKLVDDLAVFADSNPATGRLSEVSARLTFAESVEEESLRKHAARWAEAVAFISDRARCPAYEGLRIHPQLGLVPVGRDPRSGLFEFVHLATAERGIDPVPKRDASGKLVIEETTGLILVLLPGGTFRMGAVPPDEETTARDPNVDPQAQDTEAPVTTVTLEPFFLSKFEMTQGQWSRASRQNPSKFGAGFTAPGFPTADLRNPVEQVSCDDCERWLPRLGLILPTEAQWEYAARGGTTTPRSTGIGTEGLAKAANVADLDCERVGFKGQFEQWNDGHAWHAPAGSFEPNTFGLHDTLGNVAEWCRDWYGRPDSPRDPGDGLAHSLHRDHRVVRGAGWNVDASQARSSFRVNMSPDLRLSNIGVRPARKISSGP
jgi:serine/threonine protein kinase/formylglycine-generating enzyme required for sulfatase activity